MLSLLGEEARWAESSESWRRPEVDEDVDPRQRELPGSSYSHRTKWRTTESTPDTVAELEVDAGRGCYDGPTMAAFGGGEK